MSRRSDSATATVGESILEALSDFDEVVNSGCDAVNNCEEFHFLLSCKTRSTRPFHNYLHLQLAPNGRFGNFYENSLNIPMVGGIMHICALTYLPQTLTGSISLAGAVNSRWSRFHPVAE